MTRPAAMTRVSMPAFLRAAALSAAAFTFLAGAGFGGAGLASESEPAPTVPYGTHAAVPLTVANLGLNDLADPAPEVGQLQAAPVATHAMAPTFPESEDEAVSADRRTLAELVADHQASETPDEETECLARAVYYESRTESLTGQLTVAEVVLNRANSGRFASTVCGVVRQRGQFSFVRGGVIPTPPSSSRDWRTSVAIARIAMQDLADGAAPRALFFHARRVNPGWRLTRVATVGNHVFYR